MAITKTRVFTHPNPTFFRESEIIHQFLDGLKGIEIGAAAHNDFGLEGCINVGLKETDSEDFEFFKGAQAQMCGYFAEIDIEGEATNLPLEDESQDYVLTSHVIEHIENPIRAFKEWNRVVRKGGYIAIIFPKRDSLSADVGRDVSTISEFEWSLTEGWTVDTVPFNYLSKVPGGRRGHYWVFTLQSMIALIEHCNTEKFFDWKIVYTAESDDKVGNGHMLIAVKQ